MPRSTDPPARLFGLLFVGTGLFILAVGLEIIPTDPESVHAPMWVLAACGVVFLLGGLAVLAHGRPRIQAAAGVTIVLAFALIGSWVALYGEAAQMSGGIPLLPRGLNVAIGRGMFGLGALMCLGIFALGVRQILRGETET